MTRPLLTRSVRRRHLHLQAGSPSVVGGITRVPFGHAVLAFASYAAAVIAGAVTTTPAAAQIYIGPGGPVFVPDRPPPHYYGDPGFGGPGVWPGFGPISCGQGARIVASEGFRNIQPRECSGRVYRYTAFRGRVPFEVRVSSRSGEITMVRRVR